LYAKKRGSLLILVKGSTDGDDGIHLDAIAAAVGGRCRNYCILVELGVKDSVTSCKNNLLNLKK
jgi:hypothetical protein